jgi:peptidoglycan hydrolase CwlO-like protein
MCGEKWLETGNPFTEGDMSESQIEWLKAENSRLMKQVEQLMKDVHRIDSARQAAVSQCAVMAEEIEQLNEDVKSLLKWFAD